MALSLLSLPGCLRSPIYYPTTTSSSVVDQLAAAYDARRDPLVVEPDVTLTGLRHDGAVGAPVLVFFGGNAMSIVETSSLLADLTRGSDRGWGAWAYRGYDGSGGRPRQDAIFRDALVQVEHLGVGGRRLFVIGQSLGTGVAVHLAARLAERGDPPAGVVLLSPYTSIRRVADEALGLPLGWVLADRYETERELPGVRSPVLVIHGVQDDIIGIAHGREVAAALGERATLVEVPEAGHNDLWMTDVPLTRIRAFVAGHPPR
jgi:pimeloyl-ACP methyl ester carboxylesterase